MRLRGWPVCWFIVLLGAFLGSYAGRLVAVCSYDRSLPDVWDLAQLIVFGGLPGLLVGGLPALAAAVLVALVTKRWNWMAALSGAAAGFGLAAWLCYLAWQGIMAGIAV